MLTIHSWIPLLFLACHLKGQTVIFVENFDNVSSPELPAGVTVNTSQIFTASDVQSNCNVPAGVNNNLYFRNCAPSNEFRSATISGISTLGANGLTLQFCHRRTSCFEPVVSVSWSINNGLNWTPVSSYSMPPGPIPPSGSNPYQLVTLPLPSSVDNQPNLSLRWSYTSIAISSNCTSSFATCNFGAGNYRIDAVTLITQTLPVELANFSLTKKDTKAHLSWRTLSEANSDFFQIEHSSNGFDFSVIGEMEAAGFSTRSIDYHFMHENPAAGINYYRLKQLDFDGTYTYSRTLSVKFDEKPVFSFYPNPVRNRMQIELPEELQEVSTLQVFDLLGKMMLEYDMPPGESNHILDTGNLPPGHYFIKMQNGRRSTSARFVKT